MSGKIPIPSCITVQRPEGILKYTPNDLQANMIPGEKLVELGDYSRAIGHLETAYIRM